MLEKGTVIGTCECASCGKEIPLKVTKTGSVGYFCGQWTQRDDGTKFQCTGRSYFDKRAGQKLIDEYLQEKRKDLNNVSKDEINEIADNGAKDNGNGGAADPREDGRKSESGAGLFGGIFG